MTDSSTHSAPTVKLGTRAVVRQIEPGVNEPCAHCGERIGFRARQRRRWVIANVYRRRRWHHVEHFHEDCYTAAGSPHGPADATKVRPHFVKESA